MIKFYFFLLSIMQKNKNVYFLPVYQKNTPFFGGTIKKIISIYFYLNKICLYLHYGITRDTNFKKAFY